MDWSNKCISLKEETFRAELECGILYHKKTFVLLLLSRISLIEEERKRFLQFSKEEKGRQELKGVIRNAGLKWNKSILRGEKRQILNRECQKEISNLQLRRERVVSCISKMSDIVIHFLGNSAQRESFADLLMLNPEECEIMSGEDSFEVLQEMLLSTYKKLSKAYVKSTNEARSSSQNCSDFTYLLRKDESLSESEHLSLANFTLEQCKQLQILFVAKNHSQIRLLVKKILDSHDLVIKKLPK